MTSLSFTGSGGSVCSTSSPKHQRRTTKEFDRALFDEIGAPAKEEGRVRSVVPEDRKPQQGGHQDQARAMLNQVDEVDDSFGFGCGGRLSESYGFGCVGGVGGLRPKKDSSQDPFGVVGRVRAMMQEKFSSRVDFSPSENRRRTTVNFVEHRM